MVRILGHHIIEFKSRRNVVQTSFDVFEPSHDQKWIKNRSKSGKVGYKILNLKSDNQSQPFDSS